MSQRLLYNKLEGVDLKYDITSQNFVIRQIQEC